MHVGLLRNGGYANGMQKKKKNSVINDLVARPPHNCLSSVLSPLLCTLNSVNEPFAHKSRCGLINNKIIWPNQYLAIAN